MEEMNRNDSLRIYKNAAQGLADWKDRGTIAFETPFLSGIFEDGTFRILDRANHP
jgi:hypothetical protein